jgi:hypothetical protein
MATCITRKCGPFEYIEYWAHTSAPENVPHGADGIGPFSGCVDAAAHLLAALDSSEHLGIEATKRVVELLQPYALALPCAGVGDRQGMWGHNRTGDVVLDAQ